MNSVPPDQLCKNAKKIKMNCHGEKYKLDLTLQKNINSRWVDSLDKEKKLILKENIKIAL